MGNQHVGILSIKPAQCLSVVKPARTGLLLRGSHLDGIAIGNKQVDDFILGGAETYQSDLMSIPFVDLTTHRGKAPHRLRHLAHEALERVAGAEGPGDEVVMSDLTFIAPANAVRYLGAWPVFIDAEERYWQMDVNKLEDFLQKDCCVYAKGRKRY